MSPLRFACLKITRDTNGIEFLESNLTLDDRKKMLQTIGGGTPLGDFSKIDMEEDTLFFQHLTGTTEETIVSVSMANPDEIDDSLIFHPAVRGRIAYHHPSLPQHYPLRDSIKGLSEFTGLEGILFSLFTKIKMVILGEEKDNSAMVATCLSLLPPPIAKTQKFHTFMETLDPSLDWIGMPPNQRSVDQLRGKEFTHTFVSIRKKMASSPFSCELVTRLRDHIINHELNETIDLIAKIYKDASAIKNLDSAIDASDFLDIDIDDAEFLMMVAEVSSFFAIAHPKLWRKIK